MVCVSVCVCVCVREREREGGAYTELKGEGQHFINDAARIISKQSVCVYGAGGGGDTSFNAVVRIQLYNNTWAGETKYSKTET